MTMMTFRQQNNSHRLLLFSTLVAAIIVVAVVRGDTTTGDCALDCENGSHCIVGPASYHEHPKHPGTNADFEFHQINSIDNMHCDCPLSYTGLHCEVPFASCDGDHKCYHGGECIQGLIDVYGNDHNFCDCSNAFDAYGNQFIGKYCEQQATQFCDKADQTFCLNHGRCNDQYPAFGKPCLCTEGYTGDNCEYHEDTVPTCELKCQNGGHCSLGGMEHISEYDLWDVDEYPNQYCVCPDGWDGRHCEIPAVECGEHFCFHGSTCMTGVIGGQVAHHCDCTDASTNEHSYAGLYCQYEANTYCTKNPNLNGDLFCVNGGTCSKTDVTAGCVCPDGFAGFSCEFLDPEVYDTDGNGKGIDPNTIPSTPTTPTTATIPPAKEPLIVEDVKECVLECFNQGTCRFGKKDDGYLNEIAINTMHLNETHSDFMHCVCPDGFTGIQCEHAIEVCPPNANNEDDEHVCLHGSACTTTTTTNPEKDQRCDCDTATSKLAKNFAGDHCEHPVNDVCTDHEPAPGQPLSFCVNQGKCIKKITAGEEHPGCLCAQGFIGPHCELREKTQANDVVGSSTSSSSSSSSSTGTSSSNNSRTGLQITAVILSIVAILGVSLLAVKSYTSGRRRRRDATSLSLEWGAIHPTRYTDQPNAVVNLAPRSSTRVMDDRYIAAISGPGTPSLSQDDGAIATGSAIDSSTDPFTTAHHHQHHHHHHHLQQHCTSPTVQQHHPIGGNVGEPDLHSHDQHPPSPQIYFGPPRDEDGHELHNVEIA